MKNILRVALALTLVSVVLGQITITQDGFPALNSSSTIHSRTQPTQFNLGSGGENQAWSFTQVGFNLQKTWSVLDPTQTPYDGEFPTATHCIIVQDQSATEYDFFELSASEFIEIGYVTGSGQPTITELNPQNLVLPLPLTYGQAPWTSVSESITEIDEGFFLTYRDSTVHTIDGWGTLTTDYGTHSVLRVHLHHITTSTYTDLPPTIEEYFVYQWIDAHGFPVVGITSIQSNFVQGFISVAEPITSINADPEPFLTTAYALLNNFPNPFNSSTQIVYNLPKTHHVTVTIYDLLGREIVTLANGTEQIGTHKISWDGRASNGLNVPSGTYVYQIKAGNFEDAKKMMLVR